jgi:hypothetical protein
VSQVEAKLEELVETLKQVSVVTRDMTQARTGADDAARSAVDAVERELVRALDGEVLRGLPHLGDRVFGLRVSSDASAFSRLPNGKSVLVLDSRGLLVVATKFPNGTVFVQRAPRGMVRASELEAYLNVVSHGLDVHLKSAQDRTATFLRVSDLAGRVASAATDL